MSRIVGSLRAIALVLTFLSLFHLVDSWFEERAIQTFCQCGLLFIAATWLKDHAQG
jgi:hypothetical protein